MRTGTAHHKITPFQLENAVQVLMAEALESNAKHGGDS